MTDTQFVRLITGEDLVGHMIHESVGSVFLEYPLKVVYMNSDTAGMAIALVPWVLTRLVNVGDQGFEILKRDVLFNVPASASMEKYYVTAAGFMLQMEQDRMLDEEEDDDDIEAEVIMKDDTEVSEEVQKKLSEFVKTAGQMPRDKKKLN